MGLQISDMGVKAEVGIFNSIVAACAHSGEHVQARAVFDAMPSHSCQPDAVTFANLIRAYKKVRPLLPPPLFFFRTNIYSPPCPPATCNI